MTQTAQRHDTRICEEEYLRREMASDIRHEYVDGHVYAMSGASRNHERITGNVYGSFLGHLRNSSCESFASNIKVKAGTKFFYPDVMVVCDDSHGDANNTQAPVIVVEVLSSSTRRTDETIKRMDYQNLPSLTELIFVEQDFVDVEVCRRSEGWVSRHYFMGDDVIFESIGLTLAVETIYERVTNDDVKSFLDTKHPAFANVTEETPQ
jgi:Uma2 family endonuclease